MIKSIQHTDTEKKVKKRNREINTNFIIISFLFLIIDFRVFLGGNPVANLLNIIVLIFGLFSYSLAYKGELFLKKPELVKTASVLAIFAFLIIFCLSLFRTNSFLETTFGAIIMSSKVIFLFLALLYYFDFYRPISIDKINDYSIKVFKALSLALTIYLTCNLVSFFVMPLQKLESVDQEVGLIAGLLGLDLPRAGFPFSGGGHPVTIGLLAAGLFTMLLGALIFRVKLGKKFFLVTLIGLVVSLFIMIITDSRSIFLNVVMVNLIFSGLSFIRSTRLVLLLVVILPFSQLIMLNTLKLVSETSIGKEISRGKNELKSGNSRGYIYELSLKELEDFKLKHLIGYGEYGPLKVGFVKRYIHYFELGRKKLSKEEKVTISVSHNSTFQVIFDGGYVALAFFMILLYVSLNSSLLLYKSGIKVGLLLGHFVLSYCISGISETTYGRYATTYFLSFLFVSFTAIFLANWVHKEKIRLNHQPQSQA